ncbi:cadherin-like domain-containing protein [Chloroflexi bacterium TSY]|nr:cadherin-like domain-containing protein [Chloroflexi bacterium TSY]
MGDGTTTDRSTPGDVSGLTTGVAALATGQGDDHTCVVTSAGGLKCWGDNNDGEVGIGTTTDILTPVDVVGLSSGVAAVALGEDHTCAITTTGGLKCWGENGLGQVGNGVFADSLTPVDVVGLTSEVAAVFAGFAHSCAVTNAGAVKCWGGNEFGELGDGTMTNSNIPVDMLGLTSGGTAVASGRGHICVLTSAGGLQCLGDNDKGQLGDGSTQQTSVPVDVVVGNSAPLAEDDSYIAFEDLPLNVAAPGVLENDSDAEDDTLTAIKISDPSNGSVTLNIDGSFTYTPNPDFVGIDSFTYKANDGTADSNVATVTIEVSQFIGRCGGFDAFQVSSTGAYVSPNWTGDAIIVGTSSGETLTGTHMDDLVLAFGGKDTLNGLSGDDVMCGGGGDILNGGGGDDLLNGGNGTDDCQGSFGDDTITNCEGASAAGTSSDEEGASDNDENGEQTVVNRSHKIFLPLVNNKQ